MIEPWLTARGCAPTATRFHLDDPLPKVDAIDWLIVMGGPMGVYNQDRHPWLTEEIAFIREAIDRRKTVFGICLGAQLIAAALGAKVYPNTHKEIGWFPVTLTEQGRQSPLLQDFPSKLPVFHWHGDTFDLPAKSTHLMTSSACVNQAFSYGDRVIGLQFHLEVTPAGIDTLINHCGHELAQAPFIQPSGQLRADPDRLRPIHRQLTTLLDHLAEAA